MILADVANLAAPDALRMAQTAVSTAMPEASEASQTQLTSYLAGVSASLRQSLPRADNGLSMCPAALLPRTQEQALRMLPVHLPPFQAPCDLPGTDYRLVRLLGTGGFGAVYEARLRSEPLVPRVLKFCLDRERVDVLRHERRSFQRILDHTDQGSAWPRGVVRLLGDNLEYEQPFLVFEYVPDGDLSVFVENHRLRVGRSLEPTDVLAVMERITQAVAELHRVGLTHCDLKPANILFARQEPRVADLGLGAVAPSLAISASRQRTRTATVLDLRGAGTYLYSSPEQLRGAAPVPTHDIYSLGVIWYQLLIEDFSRAPGTSWRKQLASRGVPDAHLELLEGCLEEEPTERLASGQELAQRLAGLTAQHAPARQPTTPLPPPPLPRSETSADAQRLRVLLATNLPDRSLRKTYLDKRDPSLIEQDRRTAFSWPFWAGLSGILCLAYFLFALVSSMFADRSGEGSLVVGYLLYQVALAAAVTLGVRMLARTIHPGDRNEDYARNGFWRVWGVVFVLNTLCATVMGLSSVFFREAFYRWDSTYLAQRYIVLTLPLLSIGWHALLYIGVARIYRLGGLCLSASCAFILALIGLAGVITPIVAMVGFYILFGVHVHEVFDHFSGLSLASTLIATVFFAVLLFGFRLLFWLCAAARLREVYGPLPPAILDEDTCRKFLTAPH